VNDLREPVDRLAGLGGEILSGRVEDRPQSFLPLDDFLTEFLEQPFHLVAEAFPGVLELVKRVAGMRRLLVHDRAGLRDKRAEEFHGRFGQPFEVVHRCRL